LHAGDLNATKAALRAGYSAKTAALIGHENLRKPNISAAIEKAIGKRAESAELTASMVVDELRKIAFANMASYMKSTPGGHPHLDFSELTEAQTAALSEVTVDTHSNGAGDGAIEVTRVKFRLHDKRAALVDLGRHLGMFDAKHKQPDAPVEVTGEESPQTGATRRSRARVAAT
jgi:phage terminase small subunit